MNRSSLLIMVLVSFFGSSVPAAVEASGAECRPAPVILGDSDFSVRVSEYRPGKVGAKELLIMPPTGGVTFLDRNYARHFCHAGYRVQLLERWSGDDEKTTELEGHRRFYQRSQDAVGKAVQNTDGSSFLGILGTSIGAIHAAIAISKHSEIDAAFSITGGASIPEIIADSDEEGVVRVRKAQIERYGYTSREGYLRALKPVIEFDPLTLPRLFEGKSLGMVIADRDTTVPTRNQRLLRKLWKPQTEIHFDAGHRGAILKTWLFKRRQILSFFEKAAQASLLRRSVD